MGRLKGMGGGTGKEGREHELVKRSKGAKVQGKGRVEGEASPRVGQDNWSKVQGKKREEGEKGGREERRSTDKIQDFFHTLFSPFVLNFNENSSAG